MHTKTRKQSRLRAHARGRTMAPPRTAEPFGGLLLNALTRTRARAPAVLGHAAVIPSQRRAADAVWAFVSAFLPRGQVSEGDGERETRRDERERRHTH